MSNEKEDLDKSFNEVIEYFDKGIKTDAPPDNVLIFHNLKVLAILLRLEIYKINLHRLDDIMKINERVVNIFNTLQKFEEEISKIKEIDKEKLLKIEESLSEELTELTEYLSDLMDIHAMEAENLDKLR